MTDPCRCRALERELDDAGTTIAELRMQLMAAELDRDTAQRRLAGERAGADRLMAAAGLTIQRITGSAP